MVGVVDDEGGHLLHVEPVDVLLKEAEERQVEGGQPGLLALEDRWRRQQGLLGHHSNTQGERKDLLWWRSGRRRCA